MADFTWGDTVRIRADAPPQYQPGEVASVCGIREVETVEQERQFGSPVGSRLYLVEFENGDAIEVPEALLEHG